MSDNILSLRDVTMQFGGVVAVDGLSLDVERGKIVALIGPNGAGKTTAFNCITGVYEPTNGLISFNDEKMIENFPKGKIKNTYLGSKNGEYKQSIVKSPDKITKLGIARTFQNIRLFKELSVLENVMIAKHLHLKANVVNAALHLNFKEEEQIRNESLKLLEMTDLVEHQNDMASSLPYGKQRKLEIARALATNPSLLLLDEPAAGMNPQETNELTDFIVQIKEKFNLSVFMIEHHMDLVMRISDSIYVLDFGKLIAKGTPDEVSNNQRVIDAYLGVAEDA